MPGTSPPRSFSGILSGTGGTPSEETHEHDDDLLSLDSRHVSPRQLSMSQQPPTAIPRYPPGFLDNQSLQERPRKRPVEHSPAQPQVQAPARQSPEDEAVRPKTRREPEQQEEARAPTPVLEIPEIVEPVRQNVRQQQTPNLRDTPRTNIPRMPWRHMERQNTSPMKVVYREAKQEHQVNLKLSAFTPAQADIWVDMVKDSFLIHRLKI